MKIDWIAKLRHFLQTLAFCLAIAAVQYAFAPERHYGHTVVHSILIGTTTWAIIDFGRHLFADPGGVGWPGGVASVLLVAGGIAAGFFAGMTLGGPIVRALGWPPQPMAPGHWRAGVLVTILAGLTATYWFYSRSKSEWLEKRVAETQRHADEARLKLLEAQLEPHMLFNTLANLRVLIGIDPQRAQQMLDHMIAYLRATLDASRAPQHPLQAEFDRLGDYLALMAIRMGPRLDYTLDLPQELAAAPVPTLLLQPLVENSIRHGLEPKVEGGRIAVAARREGDRLLLEVRDSGVGSLPTAPSGPGRGFGLSHVRERLATLHGARADLDLQALPAGGMQALVRLPLPA